MTGSTSPELRRLGDFEILREIGRGGMGIVYEARQVSLNRKVALKVLSGGLGLTPTATARFRREAEAAAKLHHTNIVPIYATGDEDGTHFYAMELIEGPSLNVVIQQMRCGERQEESRSPATPDTQNGTTPSVPGWVAETLTAGGVEPQSGPSEAVVGEGSTTLTTGGGYFDNVARMIAEVAEALDYAHDQGVVHPDIKPSNLLLSPGGRVSINDFGLARMLEQPGMTMTGEFMGSPLYMSPEQITAGRAPLDHRTDIYSLGATLYELVILQPPFPGERRDQIIAQIISKEPKSPRRINKKVPIDLETICLKALEKDPDRRYQTAGQMADDLRKYVNRYAISAKRAGPITRTVKWARRQPAIAGLILLVVLVAGTAALFAHKSQENRLQRTRAERAAQLAEGQRALDQAQIETLCGRFDQVEPWLEKAEVMGVAPGRIRTFRGAACLEQGMLDDAIHELELAVQQLPGSVAANALLARAFAKAGKPGEQILALFDRTKELTPGNPEDYLYGAWVMEHYWPDQALKWLETLAAQHPTPVVHYHLGFRRLEALAETYDPADIEPALASMTAAKTQMPDYVPAYTGCLIGHLLAADVCKLNGNTQLHEFHLNRAAEVVRYTLEHHAGRAEAHVARARLAIYEERWQDAISSLRTAADLPGFFPSLRVYLVQLLFRQGRYQDALREVEAMRARWDFSPEWCFLHVFVRAEAEGAGPAQAAYRRWTDKYGEGPSLRGPTILHYEAHCLFGRREEAIRVSRQYRAQAAPAYHEDSFDAAQRQYICGELSNEQLLGAARNRAQRNMARFYAGLTLLADGDRAGAMEQFTEVERSGNPLFALGVSVPVLPTSFLWLERMRTDPTWPPWIPLKEGTEAQPGFDETGDAATQPVPAPSTNNG